MQVVARARAQADRARAAAALFEAAGRPVHAEEEAPDPPYQ